MRVGQQGAVPAWHFRRAIDGPLVAQMQLTTEQAWPLLSNTFDETRHGEVRATGDAEIIETLTLRATYQAVRESGSRRSLDVRDSGREG